VVRQPLVEAPDRIPDPLLMRLVRLDPARVRLRLAERLLHVRLEPLALDRPCPDERLPEEIVLVRVVERPPSAHALGPLVGHPRERADPRPDVAASLRVVRLGREQMPRKAL